MVQPVTLSQLPICESVVRRAFADPAAEFGLTAENCPSNAAFLPSGRLAAAAQRGDELCAAVVDGTILGFMQLCFRTPGVCTLEKLSVVPEARHQGLGRQLLIFAASRARERDCRVIRIGIIEENTRLKTWYTQNGYVAIGTQRLPHLPFTVGHMELVL